MFFPSSMNRRYSSPELLLFCLLISFTFSFLTSVHSKPYVNSTNEPVQWQFITKQNFSSLVRLNPHLLVLATLPNTLWSGVEHGPWNNKPYIKYAPERLMYDGVEIILTRVRTPTKTYTQKLGSVNDEGPRTPYDSSADRYEITLGSILVATENLAGLYPMDRSRILIVNVDQTGFQGLMLNRLLPWDAILPLEEGLELLRDAPLSYGGLHVTRNYPLVCLTRLSVRGEHPEVLPGVYFLDQLATVSLRRKLKSNDGSVTDYWFFVGYSAWGWSWLFDEIDDGLWNVISGTEQLLDWPME